MVKDNKKRWSAEDIAASIIDSGATDVTENQMPRWSDDDLYDWLEAFGFEYKAGMWHGSVEFEIVEE